MKSVTNHSILWHLHVLSSCVARTSITFLCTSDSGLELVAFYNFSIPTTRFLFLPTAYYTSKVWIILFYKCVSKSFSQLLQNSCLLNVVSPEQLCDCSFSQSNSVNCFYQYNNSLEYARTCKFNLSTLRRQARLVANVPKIVIEDGASVRGKGEDCI